MLRLKRIHCCWILLEKLVNLFRVVSPLSIADQLDDVFSFSQRYQVSQARTDQERPISEIGRLTEPVHSRLTLGGFDIEDGEERGRIFEG